MPLQSAIVCALCRRKMSREDMTVGLCNHTGEQAFACNGHFWNGAQFICGWIDIELEDERNWFMKNAGMEL